MHSQRRHVPLVGIGLLAILLAFFVELLDPGRLLGTRDMLAFHLPLREAWVRLAHAATAGSPWSWHLPQWDPYAHGGQPLLSDPNYGALYPPSWLCLILPVHVGLNLLVLSHALLAAFGAERLARRLGCDRAGALLAALAYACGPTYLSLLHSLPLALGMAWFPWVLGLARGMLEEETSSGGLALALATGFLCLVGEPALLAMTILALGLLALTRFRSGLGPIARLAGFLVLGSLLAGVGLVPAVARLAGSERAHGLSWSASTLWSLPWRRLPELFFPRFYGDLANPTLGRYFGWGIHDLDFPYLLLLDVGTPLALLGIAALLERSRGACAADHRLWRGCAVSGVLLALGSHTPLYAPLWRLVPGLSALRFPEKFALLSLAALIFAGASGWSRILAARARGEVASTSTPVVLAGALTLVAAACTGWAFFFPERLTELLRAHAGAPLPEPLLSSALGFYRTESLLGFCFAASSLVLFLGARHPAPTRRSLALGAVLVVTAELAIFSQPLLRTFEAREVLASPSALESSATPARTLFANPAPAGRGDVVHSRSDSELAWVRAPLERLDPRAGNLAGVAYVLDPDFDLTLTHPAARARALYERLQREPALAVRLLGAWGADHVVVPRGAQAVRGEFERGRERPAPVEVAANSFALPRARFVARALGFENAQLAEAAGIAAGLPLDRQEFLIGACCAELSSDSEARVLADLDRGDRRGIDYEGSQPSLLVVASTFDRRWSATLDGTRLPIFETLGGYLAIPVPAGRKHVELAFRDPSLALGEVASGAAAAIWLGIALRRRRAPVTAGAADPSGPAR